MTRAAPIEGFEIKEPIGNGGSSRVYLARQNDFDRDVAIKILAKSFESERHQAAFERECAAIGKLSQHPNIVTVFDTATTTDGEPCIVMQHYADGSLSGHQRLDLERLLSIGIRIAGALHTAHMSGVIHRDLKPSNIFVSEYGEPALGDFGISSFADDMTVTGQGGGLTLHYAPPEILDGGKADAKSDLYSLAATLFTLAAGERPFRRLEGETAGDLARRILVEPAPRLNPAFGPESLADLLVETMSKRPADRPESALAFGQRLQEIEVDFGFAPTPLTTPEGVASLAGPSPVSPVIREGVESRRIVSALVAVVAILGITTLAIAFSKSNSLAGQTSDLSRTTVPLSDDGFFSVPETPRDIEIASGVDGLMVSWEPVEPGVVYELRAVGSEGDVDIVSAETSPVAFPLPGDEPALCLTIRGVGADGRLSAESETVCFAAEP